jgi:hypothetical protein
MSERMEALAGQAVWGAKNLAYNLDFIADDKLNWKPAPSAASALEIAGHVVMAFNGLGGRLKAAVASEAGEAGASGRPETPTFSSREEAKTAVIAAADNYAQALRSLPAERLGDMVDLGFATFPLGFVAVMGATDVLHHHGQIAYLQTLLGDEESHFDPALFGN